MSSSYNNQFKLLSLFLLIFLSGLLLQSCGSESDDVIERPDVTDIEVDVEIRRLEQPLFEASSRNEIKAFLQENKLFAQNFLGLNEQTPDSLLVEQLWQLSQDPHLDTLYRESQQIFANLQPWEEQFETAFRYIKYYYPEFQPPVIYTVVSGFSSDLFVSEDMIVIGLDYFMGPSATFRPRDVPDYILRRYTPEYAVPGAMLLLSSYFNQTSPKDKTMLAEMIYYGKSYYFVDFVLPSVPDSLIVGFTAEELQGIRYNQGTVWNHFLKNELLYETNHIIKKKYLEERPKTLEIGDKAPGRAATWVGWQIVRAFMDKQEEVNLRELMGIEDARRIFTEAKYHPKDER